MRRRAPAVASIHYSSTPRTRPRSPLPEWRAPMNVFVLALAANTRGHIQVKTSRADGPEYQVYYARVYRRGPRGWALASHETMARVDGATQPGVFRPGDGVTLPRLLKEVKPQYTSDAMRAKIQGGVLLQVVVNTD